MQLLSACGERERVDAIFDLVPLDEALRWSLCWTSFGLGWSSREAAGGRAAAGAAQGRQSRGSALVCSEPRGCPGVFRAERVHRGGRAEGVHWCVQYAQWTVMLTLMLGGDLEVWTWV